MKFHHLVEDMVRPGERPPERPVLIDVRRQHYDLRRGLMVPEVIEHVEAAAAVGELEVQQHDVGTVTGDQFDCRPAVGGFTADFEAGNGIDDRTNAPHHLLGVFDDNQRLA